MARKRKGKRIKEMIVKVKPKKSIKLSDEEIDKQLSSMVDDFLMILSVRYDNNIINILNSIHDNLSLRRYAHSLGVAVEALMYARLIGYSETNAIIAGLLHDYCKEWGKKRSIEYIKVHNPGAETIAHKIGVHAYTASLVAKYEFGITDYQILSAIRYHTFPTPNMTNLDKILYIADYTDMTRTLFDYGSDPNWTILMTILRDYESNFQLKVTSAIHYHLEELKSSGDMDNYVRLLEAYDYQMNLVNN